MLELPDVTLCCIDTVNHRLALRALELSCAGIRFGRALFLTDALPAGCRVAAGIDVVPIGPLRSRDDYSQFVLKGMAPHVATTHMLLVQWDGYVVNPAAWEPSFLDCDYLGAKWFWHQDGMRVGNGGFSLRSRRLLDALQDPRITLVENEDTTICRTFRPLLEHEYGIRFGDEALADRFSFEAAYPAGKPFGFHGLFNFCRTMAPNEIAALVGEFSDSIARSLQLMQLLRNCNALGQWTASVAIGRRILAAVPVNAEAAALLAAAERQATQPAVVGRNDPCPCGSGRKYKHCHGALGAAPKTEPLASGNLGEADGLLAAAMDAHRRNDLAGAEHLYRRLLELAPDHPIGRHYLGIVLYQSGRAELAVSMLESSLHALPDQAEYRSNYGLVLAALDRDAEAIAAFERALELKPDYAIGWNNLGLTLQAANRLPEAVVAFQRALSFAPQFTEARWNLALALLGQGRLEEGWQEYEARLAIPALGKRKSPLDRPRWDGVVRPSSTLLLTAEQGLGDALQFARFAMPLAERGVRVLLLASEPLVRLLASVPGVAGTYAFDAPLPPYDAHIPLLSLPGLLGVSTVTKIPAVVPYLTADAHRRTNATEAVRSYPGKVKVGLAWAGSRTHRNDRRRSVALAKLVRWFGIDDIDWFSLQKGEAENDIAAVPEARRLVRLSADNDFDDTAALVAALDLVISVDTSIAHLAGALGKPVWVLLPFAPDWRWLPGRVDSPWYPTARLFRQPRPGDWDCVVHDVAAALAERCRS